MKQKLFILGSAIISFILAGFLIRPIPPQVNVQINGNTYELDEQPIITDVPIGQPVTIEVTIYHQDQQINAGTFSYRWCYTPLINSDPLYCASTNYRNNQNSDYTPETTASQTLNITIEHKSFRKAATIHFQPQ